MPGLVRLVPRYESKTDIATRPRGLNNVAQQQGNRLGLPQRISSLADATLAQYALRPYRSTQAPRLGRLHSS